MPTLKVRTELDYCLSQNTTESIREKYETKVRKERYDKSYYANEYLFPFCVPPSQIVSTWLWKDVQQWMLDNDTDDSKEWAKRVARPALEAHEAANLSDLAAGVHSEHGTLVDDDQISEDLNLLPI
jgi:hypothetical protein